MKPPPPVSHPSQPPLLLLQPHMPQRKERGAVRKLASQPPGAGATDVHVLAARSGLCTSRELHATNQIDCHEQNACFAGGPSSVRVVVHAET